MSNYAAVAEVLGVKDAARITPMDFARSVSNGLPAAATARVAHAIRPDDGQFQYRLVPRATAARKKSGALSPAHSERVARIASMWADAVSVWGGEDAARQFLFRAHPMLDDETPISVGLRSEVGAELVGDILGRLRYGSAA